MSATESQVLEILRNPFDRKWTIQGFGMLRTYLDEHEVERLHIWDTETAVPDVSVIHNHPWDFESRIVIGSLINRRYMLISGGGGEYEAADLRTGEGGGLVAEPYIVDILAREPEQLHAGETYSQLATEYHESEPSRGTVTVIKREFSRPRDFATVCWKTPEWVSAEPRPATRAEVDHFVGLALAVER
jgi:hypothetical protein